MSCVADRGNVIKGNECRTNIFLWGELEAYRLCTVLQNAFSLTWQQGQRLHVGELGNCLERHFGKGGNVDE